MFSADCAWKRHETDGGVRDIASYVLLPSAASSKALLLSNVLQTCKYFYIEVVLCGLGASVKDSFEFPVGILHGSYRSYRGPPKFPSCPLSTPILQNHHLPRPLLRPLEITVWVNLPLIHPQVVLVSSPYLVHCRQNTLRKNATRLTISLSEEVRFEMIYLC